MAPTKKSRGVNKRYSYINDVSPRKDGDSVKKSNSRKRKLTDVLGPRWKTEELVCFYDAYRKYGKDWKKVAAAVELRSSEMVETLYTMNKAYLSLPHGTASATGLTAMMADHYSNLEGSGNDHESNDGPGSSRKAQKRSHGKRHQHTSKDSDEQLVSHSQGGASNVDILSLLKKKQSGAVGKRTPRFPVSSSYEKGCPGLRLKADANNDKVAHKIATALAEASQKGGSPQVSQTQSRRTDSVTSSPFQNCLRMISVAEKADAKLTYTEPNEEDLEESMEADTAEWTGLNHLMMESTSRGILRKKGRKPDNMNYGVYSNYNNDDNPDDINEECSGSEEGQILTATRGNFETGVSVTEPRTYRSSLQSHKRKSKKALFRKDEVTAIDALQTLADLSRMMPSENEDDSRVQFKDEDDNVHKSILLEAVPANQKRQKRRYSGVKMKGHQPILNFDIPSSESSKLSIAESKPGPLRSLAKANRKTQRIQVSKKTQVHPTESPRVVARDAEEKVVKRPSQSGSPKLVKISENSTSNNLRIEASISAQSAVQTHHDNLPTKVRSRRKMAFRKPEVQRDPKFFDKFSDDNSNLPFASDQDPAFNLMKNLSNCLSNSLLRRWCTYEWFYSAIDYPWFAKREFVDYLYHVGLGHVTRLTRVEWDVIRSSLGKPRRFSERFVKVERDKLYQYRDSVRKHYTELRRGVKEGLPTDLTRPLSVGQRVIAIHPKTREVHEGSVLTVDHSRCQVQFDRPELGVEFVMDFDCMPFDPLENMPALIGRHPVSVYNLLANNNELKINGRAQDYMKLVPDDNVDSQSQLANPISLSKQSKVASGIAHITTYQQMTHSHPISLTPPQSKEGDAQVIAELTRALDKKDAIVLELRLMNDEVTENQKCGDNSWKDSEQFKKYHAAVLIQLNQANEQVSSAIYYLRQRNAYQGITSPLGQNLEHGSHSNEIIKSSRRKARAMVDAAIQAISTLKTKEDTIEKIEDAIDYVNDRLPVLDDSSVPMANGSKSTSASDLEAKIPSDMISRCVATLLMIQKCTERQFPPSDVAQILDSAVTSLEPHSSRNLPVYTEIQKCMGIIRNQIMALIPTTTT